MKTSLISNSCVFPAPRPNICSCVFFGFVRSIGYSYRIQDTTAINSYVSRFLCQRGHNLLETKTTKNPTQLLSSTYHLLPIHLYKCMQAPKDAASSNPSARRSTDRRLN
uniref:Uncharacterized protein n=1 Tax=Zea mays TaxID=4577 RepID=A0A804Q372_MAIZE